MSSITPKFGLLIGLGLLALGGCGVGNSDAVSGVQGPAMELSGRLEVWVEEDFSLQASRSTYFLSTPEGDRLALVSDNPEGLAAAISGDQISGEGFRSGNEFYLNEGHVSPAAERLPVVGRVSVAVLLVNFTDDQSEPWTPAEVERAMFGPQDSVRAYYEEASFGKLTPNGDVFGWATLPMESPTDCDPYVILSEAIKRDDFADRLGEYSALMLGFPQTCANWEGLGTIGSISLSQSGGEARQIAVSWINGSSDFRAVAAHELGHNFGLQHANSFDCQNEPIGDSCNSMEYGDVFDVMGFVAMGKKPKHMNARYKEILGWLDSTNIKEVTKSGTYHLAPLEQSSLNTQVVKVKRDEQSWYYLEYRRPTGFDDQPEHHGITFQGVTIRLVSSRLAGGKSQLLDMTANETYLDFQDATLLTGQTFFDEDSQIVISPKFTASGSATVEILMNVSAAIPAVEVPIF